MKLYYPSILENLNPIVTKVRRSTFDLYDNGCYKSTIFFSKHYKWNNKWNDITSTIQQHKQQQK
ncbi:hypothetical protein DERP_001524 [Dermatophagoides pteronyssinus]|uniref:Uncharacterized protein n=1 Tax=Dermatophagoides pteronyssinus TaxID=6956 RepID=A0ABQ8JF76_DERPT|nr:hypothetical protein DERP_001524 [Dermatophagoides pteronyssinus]